LSVPDDPAVEPDGERRAVLLLEQGFDADDTGRPFVLGEDLLPVRLVEVEVVGDVQSQDFLGRAVSKHPGEGAVDEEEPSVDRRMEDPDGGELHELAVLLREGGIRAAPPAGRGNSDAIPAPGRPDGNWAPHDSSKIRPKKGGGHCPRPKNES